LRQTVHASVDLQRKRLLHTLAGEYFEASSQPGLAAEHLWLAGALAGARKAWSGHVWELRTRGLLVDGAEVLRRAIGRLPEGEDATWLRLQLVDTLREADRLDESRRALEAVELSDDSPPALQLRRAQAEVGLLLQNGLVAESDGLLRASHHLLALVDDADLLIDHTMFQARVAREQRRLEDAVALLEPVVARLRRGRPTARLAQFLTSL